MPVPPQQPFPTLDQQSLAIPNLLISLVNQHHCRLWVALFTDQLTRTEILKFVLAKQAMRASSFRQVSEELSI